MSNVVTGARPTASGVHKWNAPLEAGCEQIAQDQKILLTGVLMASGLKFQLVRQAVV